MNVTDAEAFVEAGGSSNPYTSVQILADPDQEKYCTSVASNFHPHALCCPPAVGTQE